MTREIEKKFVPINEKWRTQSDTAQTVDIEQGYFNLNEGMNRVRIRVYERAEGKGAFIYLKNGKSTSIKIKDDATLDALIEKCCSPMSDEVHYVCDATIDDPNAPLIEEHRKKYGLDPESTVRIRITTNKNSAERHAYLTIKSPRMSGTVIDRTEIEMSIPLQMADTLMEHVMSSTLKKTRYLIKQDDPNLEWVVDEFTEPRHKNLTLSEVELKYDAQDTLGDSANNYLNNIALPDFIVSDKGEYMDVTEKELGFTSSKLSRITQEDGLPKEIKQAIKSASKVGGKVKD